MPQEWREPEWTQENPAVGGLYAYWEAALAEPVPVLVFMDKQWADAPVELDPWMVWDFFAEDPEPMFYFKGWWWGPMPAPPPPPPLSEAGRPDKGRVLKWLR